MLQIKKGDMFASEALLLTNPVNCKGFMGAGLAKTFKDKYPYNFYRYKEACVTGILSKAGDVFFCIEKDGKVIVNFPTILPPLEGSNQSFKFDSTLEGIKAGLKTLRDVLVNTPEYTSIALPALGCGIGRLRLRDVQPLLEEYLGDIPHCPAELWVL